MYPINSLRTKEWSSSNQRIGLRSSARFLEIFAAKRRRALCFTRRRLFWWASAGSSSALSVLIGSFSNLFSQRGFWDNKWRSPSDHLIVTEWFACACRCSWTCTRLAPTERPIRGAKTQACSANSEPLGGTNHGPAYSTAAGRPRK